MGSGKTDQSLFQIIKIFTLTILYIFNSAGLPVKRSTTGEVTTFSYD